MCRVLIIEDSSVNMLLEAAVLSRSGHKTFQAKDAVDGVRMAQEVRPDVILMDLGLPQLDGFAATRILKGDPATKDIPIIAVTASDTRADKEQAAHDGFDGYVTKPITPRELMAEIETVSRKKPLDF